MNENKRFARLSRAFFLFLYISFPCSANLRREMTIFREREHTAANGIFFPSFDTAPVISDPR